ncbi:hypothetical protein [Thalassospira lucentensis]|uniref:hypothetical protein n=1 Tax=Thalassospira lucentensis TaxID=168935 RepID=UPI002942431F|nr:hypothetical protein [Thalassospira lucentensis]WOI08928.1 hypothetical protein R1T41_00435 [Thalassospira lucentensis]
MMTINWAASYASARQLLMKRTGQEPAPEQIWATAVTAVCIEFDDLTYSGIISKEEPGYITLVAVIYRGRTIIMVFAGDELIDCYLELEPAIRFASLELAMDEIDKWMDLKPAPAPEPETSFEP